jgi:AcrR family transcriptional regulator
MVFVSRKAGVSKEQGVRMSGPAGGHAEVVRAATRHYLRGAPIDMTSLAAELGLGRATLYRRVGNHEHLLGLVLADRTAHTFRETCAAVATTGATGRARVLAVFERFVHAVVEAEPLRALVARDPLLFIRVVMAPGAVESAATELVTALLDEEVGAGHLRLRLPSDTIAQAFVRIGDSFMYSHLLGRRDPEIHKAVALVTLLLESAAG